MTFHITMNDANPEGNRILEIFPHHRESRLEISQTKGNPSVREVLAIFWFRNEDLKKAVKALEDLS